MASVEVVRRRVAEHDDGDDPDQRISPVLNRDTPTGTELVRLPESALNVEVARDLVDSDRFGGPAPSRSDRFRDMLGPMVPQLLLVGLGLAALVAVRPISGGYAGARAGCGTWCEDAEVKVPSCPTQTRLYQDGRVVAEGFPAGEVAAKLDEFPDAVLWLDLDDPDTADLEAIAEPFHLHPLAIEDAVQDHEAPQLRRYPGHLFLNVYALDIAADGDKLSLSKNEISAFVTERALITVRKSPSDTAPLVGRWDADAALIAAGGVSFLLYGLLVVVLDGQFAVAQRLDAAVDAIEDALIEEGAAPRPVRMRGVALRKLVATVRRPVAPMPDLVSRAMRTDGHNIDEQVEPYYRDVEDHARHTVDEVEHLRDRIEGVLQADLAEQGNALNDITRKLAAWAAVIAVPTALTGFFGQNLPYPGYETTWGFVVSTVIIAGAALGLYLYLRRRGWL